MLVCGSGNGVAIVANKVAGDPRRQRARRRRGRDGAPPQRRERRDAVRRAARSRDGRRDRRHASCRPTSRAAATAPRGPDRAIEPDADRRRTGRGIPSEAMTELPPDFFNRPLADVDPEIADVLAQRARAPAADAGDDRLGELRPAGGARVPGQRADEQVRRGLSGPALLRRLRVRRHRRAARDRPRQGAVRGRARERPAARRRAGQHRRLPRAACSPGDTIMGLSLAHGGHLIARDEDQRLRAGCTTSRPTRSTARRA